MQRYAVGLPPPPDPLDHYRSILLRHFERNRLSASNPDGIFFFGFDDRHLEEFRGVVPKVLTQLARPFVMVDCAGKTDCQIYREGARALGKDVSDTAGAYIAGRALYDALLHGACTLVLMSLSKGKGSRKSLFARGLIKLLDDAHFDGVRPMSDVIFIDRASFLDKGWEDIGAYLRLVSPFDAASAWIDKMDAGRPTLIPVE
ncbi:MAG: hypothetical protein AB1744_07080 [Candidatus Zixiibacteriota bacterium]